MPKSRSSQTQLTAAALAKAFAKAFALGALALVPGCSDLEKAPPQALATRSERSFELIVPPIMRGTIASEAILLGYEPTVVRGYGLVVGLDGTGSRDIPPDVRAHMLMEMARHGIGDESAGLGPLNPERMLDSTETAVVIVEGVILPGSVGRKTRQGFPTTEGTTFDVRVYADPRTGTTSLEGGRLYTADLRPIQPGEILPPTGSRQAAPLAEAGGPVFVNPFAEPGAIGQDTVNRTVGRVLGGGSVLRDMPIKLRLATPSHSRAEIIQHAINTRYPQEPGQVEATARGASGEIIGINVPPSWRDDPETFIELLRHTSIRQVAVEAIAQSIRRVVENDPTYASDASWRWQALGQRCLPMVRALYDTADELPRIAALRAGAKLDDPLVAPHLIEMTQSENADIRREAAALLADLGVNPRVDDALRALLDDPDVEVRLVAYESLVTRNDPRITRYIVGEQFLVDVVDSGEPMIYVSQVGRPRVALFGRDMAIDRPIVMSTWSGRLMMQADADDEQIEVFYRDAESGDRIILHADPALESFVRFLGHRTTVDEPDPGLGLTYGESIGALYQMWRQSYIKADFKAEQDRVLAAIARMREREGIEERPEFSDPSDEPAEGGAGAGTNDAEPLAAPPLSRADG